MTQVMSGMLRVFASRTGAERDLILHTGTAPDGRFDLRTWLSEDEGETWFSETVIVPGFAQYSLPVIFRDGSIGVVFESLGTGEDSNSGVATGLNVQFARFDLSVVDGGR